MLWYMYLISVDGGNRGPGQSPPRFSPHTLVASAPTLRHPTRDESDIHDMMLNKQTSLPNQHGTAFFIDF